MMEKHFKKILEQEISRKDFLQYVGMALIGLIGINSVISALSNPKKDFEFLQSKDKQSGRKFNGGRYGV